MKECAMWVGSQKRYLSFEVAVSVFVGGSFVSS